MQNESLFQMVCMRKHFINTKLYHLQIFDSQMLLSDKPTMIAPKYVIPFDFEQRIMWRNSELGELQAFGLLYKSKIKWFEGDNSQLNSLKIHLSGRVFFGNISIFYDSQQVIGSGASSKVCLVKRKSDLLSYAAKCISKQYLTLKKSNDRFNRLQQEIEILQMLDHPQFVKLLEIYQGENSYYLVTDYLEGDTLYNFIKCWPSDTLPNEIVRTAIQKILISLEYLEQLGIVHRDIKLENILLAQVNDINSLKIIDLGLAIYQKSKSKLCVCGTPGYIAPEVLRNDNQNEEYFTSKCDVFSAGVILYKLLTKKTLFRAQNTGDIMEVNKRCQINYQEIEFKVQNEALNLLMTMLEPNPKNRPLASECLKHPYFSCKLMDRNMLSQNDRATGFSAKTNKYSSKCLNSIGEQRDSNSVGTEGQADVIKRCNPTQYQARINLKQKSRSPRKYAADSNIYFPSFCENKSFESDNSKSFSREISKFDQLQGQIDEIIEDQK